ncbi:MAG: hypothetical protein F4W92_08905 [Gammaproteobacteria bacterium]|nr:hypothetical protein [Gammaproteobacteria bacterium]
MKFTIVIVSLLFSIFVFADEDKEYGKCQVSDTEPDEVSKAYSVSLICGDFGWRVRQLHIVFLKIDHRPFLDETTQGYNFALKISGGYYGESEEIPVKYQFRSENGKSSEVKTEDFEVDKKDLDQRFEIDKIDELLELVETYDTLNVYDLPGLMEPQDVEISLEGADEAVADFRARVKKLTDTETEETATTDHEEEEP